MNEMNVCMLLVPNKIDKYLIKTISVNKRATIKVINV